MRKQLISIYTFVAAISLTSCATLSTDKVAGEWNITEINGTALGNVAEGGEQPFMGFDLAAKRVYGNSGCNRMSGTLDVNTTSGAMRFVNVASTRMACPNMAMESKVLEAVNDVASYKKLSAKTIGLYDGNNNMVLKLVKK